MNGSKKARSHVRALRLGLGWLVAAACVACLLAPRSARADEEKTYAGASCQTGGVDMVAGTAGPHDKSHNFSAQSGSITNLSSTAAPVDCPIVKSVVNDGNLKSVKVYVDLGPGGGSASCTLGAYGSTMGSPRLVTASTSGKRLQTISFAATTTWPSPGGSPWNYYQLSCTLPPGAALRSYYVNESGTRSDTQKIYSPAGCTVAEATSCAELYGDSLLETHQEPNCAPTGQAQFICPVVMDNKGNTGGMDLELSYLTPGYTPAAVHHGQCTLYSTNATGTTITGATTLDLSALPAYPHGTLIDQTLHVAGGAWAKYYLSCGMEGSGDARFVSYRTTEHGTGEATTADSKGYPGSLCSANPYSGAIFSGDPYSFVNHESNGSIYGGLANSEVWCPIIGDHVNTPNGINAVRVNLNEGSNDDVTTCTVEAYDPTGIINATGTAQGRWNPFGSTSATVPASKNGTNYTLSLGAVGGGVTAPVYSLHCVLSEDTTLRNYEVDEK